MDITGQKIFFDLRRNREEIFQAGLRRNTKCYTKSIEILKYSVLLLMKYRNKELGIFT
jgi:hypothetical protein